MLFAPVFETDNGLMATAGKALPARNLITNKSIEFEATVNTLYGEAGLEESGLRRTVFEYAYKGYLYLLEQHKIEKSDVITICDFSQS
ncbi:MAG TPA: hypothetical protein VHC50_02385, partial [Puia sp.]|nr:hypothetical protein [Puia sp.]